MPVRSTQNRPASMPVRENHADSHVQQRNSRTPRSQAPATQAPRGHDYESRRNIDHLQSGRRQDPQINLEEVDDLWNSLDSMEDGNDFDLMDRDSARQGSSRTSSGARPSVGHRGSRPAINSSQNSELPQSLSQAKNSLQKKINESRKLSSQARSQLQSELEKQSSKIRGQRDVEKAFEMLDEFPSNFESLIEKREELCENLDEAQRTLNRRLENNRSLTPSAREELKRFLSGRLQTIRDHDNVEDASRNLDGLETELERRVSDTQHNIGTQRNQERSTYLSKVSSGLDSLIQADLTHNNYVNGNMTKVVKFQGTWWDGERHWLVKDLVNSYYGKAKELAGKLKSYMEAVKAQDQNGGSSPSTSEIKSYIEGLDKHDKVRVVQIVLGAMYKGVGKNQTDLDKALVAALPPDVIQSMQSAVEAGRGVGNISRTDEGAKFLKYKNEGDPPRYTDQLAGDDSFVYFDPNEVSSLLGRVRSNAQNSYLSSDYDRSGSESDG